MSRERLIANLRAVRSEIEPGQEVEVGLFREEDAQGIALAYLEIYGDSFPIEHVYDPAEITRRNASDDQYTIVARTMSGDVVGLAGLFRHAPNPDVYEAGQLMVLKTYRSSHVAAEIARNTLGIQARNLGLPVVFGEAVCNHPVSQRLAHQEGMLVTGLELECMPAAAYAKEGGVFRNVSLLLMFSVYKRQRCTVYLPSQYEDFLKSLYTGMGLVRDHAGAEPLSGGTESSEFLLPDAGLLRLTISRAGEDFQSVVADAEHKVGECGLVQCYLNLGDPAAPDAITMLRERGYFFGGLLPHWFGPDGVVMQKLPEQPDWDALRLYGKEAKAMCDYIRQDYERTLVQG
ncbi:GNAT family N-acetyltransferase [Desulfovibrio mangrovi]|uniref:GNAT family N-acetyltransferase n=1 Tax=Desulfovibrio mangrovi TaxID=2976983 RepID=UPI002247ABD3|nr:GNAT family N-acetyltransferase [Desulfovibrio mangrovi]UZP68121.1 GNAT family N-acetyltransferase [Desulfovibrio mangrovi]